MIFMSRYFVCLSFLSPYSEVWSKHHESALNGYTRSFANVGDRNVIFI